MRRQIINAFYIFLFLYLRGSVVSAQEADTQESSKLSLENMTIVVDQLTDLEKDKSLIKTMLKKISQNLANHPNIDHIIQEKIISLNDWINQQTKVKKNFKWKSATLEALNGNNLILINPRFKLNSSCKETDQGGSCQILVNSQIFSNHPQVIYQNHEHWLKFYSYQLKSVYKTKETIKPHQIIDPSQIEITKEWVKTTEEIMEVKESINFPFYKSYRNIANENIILKNDLHEIPIIKMNELVKVIYKGHRVEISTQGHSLSTAKFGEVVSVRPIGNKTQKKILATAIAPGLVEINNK